MRLSLNIAYNEFFSVDVDREMVINISNLSFEYFLNWLDSKNHFLVSHQSFFCKIKNCFWLISDDTSINEKLLTFSICSETLTRRNPSNLLYRGPTKVRTIGGRTVRPVRNFPKILMFRLFPWYELFGLFDVRTVGSKWVVRTFRSKWAVRPVRWTLPISSHIGARTKTASIVRTKIQKFSPQI